MAADQEDGATLASSSDVPSESDLSNQLAEVAKELADVDAKIAELHQWRRLLADKQSRLQQKVTESRAARLADQNWDTRQFPWSERLATVLRDQFGIATGFRPLQLAAMNASLSGHDVLLVMPTGGGKSLCYQLPALAGDGVTLVVTPLVSLMEDQVTALRRRGMAAEMLNAATTRQEASRILADMANPRAEMRLLYATPEKLAKSKRFMTKLQAMHKLKRFARLAIDEVHCCSQWGHDFRPDYKFLGIMKGMFPGVPIMGLTATSTSGVTRDVQKMLHIPEAIVFKAAFNRPNLFYQVRPKPAAGDRCVEELVTMINSTYRNQSGIIYTTTIKDTEDLAEKLCKAGVTAAPYHARLEASQRSRIHQRWLADKVRVVVATIAFGMGIDKPDVRFVIHHSLSKSLENYYQESGRAGRDGRPADCVLLFRLQDIFSLSTMVFTDSVTGLDNLYTMVRYCLAAGRCRRQLIAQHFEERWTAADCARQCDVCRRPVSVQRQDVTRHAQALQRVLARAAVADTRLTAPKLLDAWLGRGPEHLRVPGMEVPALSRTRAEAIVAHLLTESYIKEDFHFTPYKTISYLVPGPNEGNYPVEMEVGDAATSSSGGTPSCTASKSTSAAGPSAARTDTTSVTGSTSSPSNRNKSKPSPAGQGTAAAAATRSTPGKSKASPAGPGSAAAAATRSTPGKSKPSPAGQGTAAAAAALSTPGKSKPSPAGQGSAAAAATRSTPGKRSAATAADDSAAKRRRTLLSALAARGVVSADSDSAVIPEPNGLTRTAATSGDTGGRESADVTKKRVPSDPSAGGESSSGRKGAGAKAAHKKRAAGGKVAEGAASSRPSSEHDVIVLDP